MILSLWLIHGINGILTPCKNCMPGYFENDDKICFFLLFIDIIAGNDINNYDLSVFVMRIGFAWVVSVLLRGQISWLVMVIQLLFLDSPVLY